MGGTPAIWTRKEPSLSAEHTCTKWRRQTWKLSKALEALGQYGDRTHDLGVISTTL